MPGTTPFPRILVVDDDPAVRWILRLTLERAGYLVVEADNGEQGLEKLQALPCQLAIMDFMPERDGIALIPEAKRDNPDLRIIAAADVQGDWPILRAMHSMKRLGADRVFRKPWNITALLDAIDEELRERTAESPYG